MKHKASRELYEYWNRLRGDDPAPLRSAIEPSDIRRVLADTFIAEANGSGDLHIRLAGTRICALYGRELKGSNLLDQWPPEDRSALTTLGAAVSNEGAVAVVTMTGHASAGLTVPCELLLLPLRHGTDGFDRVLGALAPLEQPYWLGAEPVVRQRISGLRLIWPGEDTDFSRRRTERAPSLRAAAAPVHLPLRRARRRGHLYVVDGGKC